ncbi:unnamed protein product [Caenorhabditis bovis]|uniref:Uncharacterized protein n=1 Tax=Caenorhabditis bovis TaxID=2654633 RepID=A0A8S1FE71_9PELO|nr:unnamed protein product [Caenorhabditis bovis]
MSDQEELDQDYGPSEATILFANEVRTEFRKAFPLRSETQKKLEMTQKRNACRIRKQLNFDESMSPIALQAEVQRASFAIESKDRKLEDAEREIAKLKEKLEEKDTQYQKVLDEKEKLEYAKLELTNLSKQTEARLNEVESRNQLENEYWRTIGRKYYIWFKMANEQLEEIHDILSTGGSFDERAVQRINQAPMNIFMQLKDINFCENNYAQSLAAGSLLEFSGVQFEPQTAPQLDFTLFDSRIEGARFGENSTTFQPPKPENADNTILSDTIFSSNSTMADNSTILTGGGRANMSSFDYERDEKIQRLLLENSVLKDRLNVSKGRAEQSLIFEEKNRTLEKEKQLLQSKLDKTFSEIEAMRMGTARKLFSIDEEISKSGSSELNSQNKALKMVDRINNLLSENTKMEKEIASATSKIMSLTKQLNECDRRNSRVEDAYSEQLGKSIELENKLTEMTNKNYLLEQEITQLRQNIQCSVQPTDAGNTTQIFHMPQNPLEAAHEEFQAAETRKRKLSEYSDDPEAKRKREELVEELEERLRKAEIEKNIIEDSYNLHKDLASKFRQVCVALTGLQIKLKDADEGICTVQSEYEGRDRQFVFKCFYGTTRIDMLDVNSDQSSETIRKWEPLMRKYIGERNSIPAFLAAVTLQLEQERDFDQTILERTHTFSVLHAD